MNWLRTLTGKSSAKRWSTHQAAEEYLFLSSPRCSSFTNASGVAFSQEEEPQPSPSPSEAAASPSPTPDASPAPSPEPQPAPSPSGEVPSEGAPTDSTAVPASVGELPNPCEQLLECPPPPPIQDCLPSTTTTSNVAPPDLCPPPPPPDPCTITTMSTSNVELPPCVPDLPPFPPQFPPCDLDPWEPVQDGFFVTGTAVVRCPPEVKGVTLQVCLEYGPGPVAPVVPDSCMTYESAGNVADGSASSPCFPGHWRTYAMYSYAGRSDDEHSGVVELPCIFG